MPMLFLFLLNSATLHSMYYFSAEAGSGGSMWDYLSLAGHVLSCTIRELSFVYKEKGLFWPIQVFP